MTLKDRVELAIALIEVRLPVASAKAGAVRDVYLLLKDGKMPERTDYADRRHTKPPRHKQNKPHRARPQSEPIMVTSAYIQKRFGIKV